MLVLGDSPDVFSVIAANTWLAAVLSFSRCREDAGTTQGQRG